MQRVYSKVLCLVFLFTFSNSFSQNIRFDKSYKYNYYLGYLSGQGYQIAQERVCSIKQGDYCYLDLNFKAGTEIKIVGFTDDNDVSDLDLFVVNIATNSNYDSDTDSDNFPEVSFTPYSDRYLRVKLKNVKSSTPTYASKCYFFIAYR